MTPSELSRVLRRGTPEELESVISSLSQASGVGQTVSRWLRRWAEDEFDKGRRPPSVSFPFEKLVLLPEMDMPCDEIAPSALSCLLFVRQDYDIGHRNLIDDFCRMVIEKNPWQLLSGMHHPPYIDLGSAWVRPCLEHIDDLTNRAGNEWVAARLKEMPAELSEAVLHASMDAYLRKRSMSSSSDTAIGVWLSSAPAEMLMSAYASFGNEDAWTMLNKFFFARVKGVSPELLQEEREAWERHGEGGEFGKRLLWNNGMFPVGSGHDGKTVVLPPVRMAVECALSAPEDVFVEFLLSWISEIRISSCSEGLAEFLRERFPSSWMDSLPDFLSGIKHGEESALLESMRQMHAMSLTRGVLTARREPL